MHTEPARCPSPSCPIHITNSSNTVTFVRQLTLRFRAQFVRVVFGFRFFFGVQKKLSQLDATKLDRCVWASVELVPLERACKLLPNVVNCQVQSQMIRLIEMVPLLQPRNLGTMFWAKSA